MADDVANYLEEYHRQWIDLETRRRLLGACFILDTQREKLFEQHASVEDAVARIRDVAKPCSTALWTATDPQQWHQLLSEQDECSTANTPFHCSLAHSMSLGTTGTISANIPPDILAYSLQLATHSVVRPLLCTASGSWLFTRKVSEANWHTARSQLRDWVGSQDATIAAWLAGKVLRAYFAAMPSSQTTASIASSHPVPLHSRAGIIRLETQWCLYLAALVLWAYTLPASLSTSVLPLPQSAAFSRPNAPAPIDTSGTSRRSQTHPLAQMTPLSPLVTILPSQPEATPSLQSSPTLTQTQDRSHPQPLPKPIRHSRRRQPKLASQASDSNSLYHFLTKLDTETWQEVVAIRATGGCTSLLRAVREALSGEVDGGLTQRVVVEMGSLVGEAVGVLTRLEGGRGVTF
jgi:hypothetical protein